MPRDTGAAATAGDGSGADASAQSGANGTTSSAANDTRPGGGLGVPLDPGGDNDPWAKYKWWILGGLGLAMAVGAGIMLKNGPAQVVAPLAVGATGTIASGPIASGSDSQLAAMKEELFSLETDKLQGRLTESEYVEQKGALEVVLRRALLRGERAAESSNIAGPVV